MKATDEDDKAEDEAAPKDQDWHWADPKSLKVNPAFQRLIPLQSREELRALDASIRAEGCRDPLTVWKGHNVILDGHTRRELCLGHKLKVKVRDVELADEKAAIEYILQLQRQRRNLTREAMSYFRGSEYNRIKQSHGGARRGRRPKDQSEPLRTAASLLAGKYGVSQTTIKRDGVFAKAIDKIVEEHGEPEIKRKLLGADVKLTQGRARALLKMPPRERKKAVEELVERGKLPRAKKGEDSRRRPRELAQSLVARLQKRSEGHARSVVRQMARLVGLKVVEEENGE